jgi:hypothetical protein
LEESIGVFNHFILKAGEGNKKCDTDYLAKDREIPWDYEERREFEK